MGLINEEETLGNEVGQDGESSDLGPAPHF